jgi:hypothetical protein
MACYRAKFIFYLFKGELQKLSLKFLVYYVLYIIDTILNAVQVSLKYLNFGDKRYLVPHKVAGSIIYHHQLF